MRISFALAVAAALLLPLSSAASRPLNGGADKTLAPYFAVRGAEPGIDPLPLKSTQVDAKVSGVIADVRVRQIYRNEGNTPLDASYLFPASARAAVHALRLRVNERVVDAEIREKKQARREFDEARREGKSASLLEQHRPNVFQMAIANVMPGDEITVDLRYTEIIVPDEGTYRFVFPTVVGPRYNSPGDGSGQNGEPAGTIDHPFLRKGESAPHTFALELVLVAPMPVRHVTSPSHRVTIDGVGTTRAAVRLPADRAHTNRDVVIEYRLAGASTTAGVLLHQGEDENFFLAMVEPPARVAPTEIVPRDYVFIVDVSGSMRGFPLATAKSLLRQLVAGLRPSDTFNVIPFAGGHSLVAPQSLPATKDNVALALRFIDGQTGAGGTELLPALKTALAMPSDLGRARSFVVVTDGYVSIEKEAFDLVRANLGTANVFAFGIGSSVNRFLIEGLARAGKGEPIFVLNAQQADEAAVRFRAYIEQPLLTRIRVTFEDFDAYDLDNPQLPDLFAQRPLVLIGKYRGEARGSIELEGRGAEGLLRLSLPIETTGSATQDTRALRHLWARSRIAQLGDYQKLGNDEATRRVITELGLRYGLLTDYTSFIAIDKIVRNTDGAAAAVDHPQPLPEGVEESALAVVPSTPEPEFAALAVLTGALAWWLRRRRANVTGARRG